jgi:biotin carboxyl carrier protein
MIHKDRFNIIEVNGSMSFSEYDLEKADIRILNRSGHYVDILFNHKIFRASILEFDSEHKKIRLNVQGFDFNVRVSEPLDQLVKELGFLKAHKHSVKEILSPMPGLVVNIFVNEGQFVSEGENLLSLEAMKMENIIKSPGDGQVKSILVSPSQAVDKNQMLIEFE